MSRDPFDENPIVLSDDECAAVQAWVDRVKPMLGLAGHVITVTPHKADKSTFATSFHRDEADDAVIALPGSLADVSADDLRQTLTHELLHCHFQPLTLMVGKLIAGELGRRTEAIIDSAITQVEERTIERMATAIARLLPYVTEPKAA